MRRFWEDGRACDGLPAQAAVARARQGLASAPGLSDADRAVLGFVAALTLRPHGTTRDEVAVLRKDAGLDEAGVVDVVQVTACFAYMNRLADGTGVLIMEKHQALACELFGEGLVAEHMAWGAPTP